MSDIENANKVNDSAEGIAHRQRSSVRKRSHDDDQQQDDRSNAVVRDRDEHQQSETNDQEGTSSREKPSSSKKKKKRKSRSPSPDKKKDKKKKRKKEEKRNKKSKRKSRKRRRSSSPSSSSGDSSSSKSSGASSNESDSSPEANSHSDCESNSEPPIKRYKVLTKKEKNAWSLPTEMADYANLQFNTYVPEADLEEDILEESPIPTNFNEPKKLDDFMKPYLAETPAIFTDNTYEKIQKRIRQVMGPLARLWLLIENNAKTPQNMPMEEAITLTEHVMITLGQASHSITYGRRLNALKTVIHDPKEAKTILKDKIALLDVADENLFGKKFRSYVKEMEKSKQKGHFFKKPFSKRPPQGKKNHRGGGRTRGGNFKTSRGYRGNRRNNNGGSTTGRRSRNSNGKSSTKTKQNNTFLQHPISTNCSTRVTKSCTSSSKGDIPRSKHPGFTPCRSNKKLCSQLGKINTGQGNLVIRKGLRNSISCKTLSEKPTKANQVFSGRNRTGGSRSERDVEERCYPDCGSHSRGISKQSLSSTKKRRGKPSSNKSERTKRPRTLRKIQNGRFAFSKIPSRARRLSLQNRLERCLLLCPIRGEVKEICQVQMVGKSFRISLPLLWLNLSPKDFYKIVKNPSSYSEKDKHQDNNLPRRYATDGKDHGRNFDGKGHVDFYVSTFRFSHKLEKINSEPSEGVGISGLMDRFSNHDSFINSRESKKSCVTLQGNIFCQESLNITTDSITWTPIIDNTGCPARSFTVPISAITADQSLETTENIQRLHSSWAISQEGTEVVDNKSETVQWSQTPITGTPFYNSDRCIKKGMGCPLQGSVHGRKMVQEREKSTYKSPGTHCSETRSIDVHKKYIQCNNSPPSGQQNCLVIPPKNGRHKEQTFSGSVQRDMELPAAASDHDYCRIPSKRTEHIGRLGVSKSSRPCRLETGPSDVQKGMQHIGATTDRPFRIPPMPSVAKIFCMETGPEEHSNRCISTTMGEQPKLCFSSILLTVGQILEAEKYKIIDVAYYNYFLKVFLNEDLLISKILKIHKVKYIPI